MVIAGLERQLAGLQGDMAALTMAQALLANQTRGCCHNDTALVLLIREAIREHLAGVSIAHACLSSLMIARVVLGW